MQTAEFTNTYAATGEGEIKVKKTLTGREWTNDDEFTFTVSAEEGTPMPESTIITIKKSDTDQTKSFGTIPFTAAGTYTYKVKETKGELGGITYDETEHTVTIKVVDDGNGHLIATEDSALVQTEAFTNTYAATGEGEIKVKKTLTGREWTTEDSFEFTITPVGVAPVFNTTDVTITKNTDGYTASFGTVTFSEPGTYQWTIAEAHKGELIKGVSYDAEDKTITMVVVDDGQGHLVADTGSALVQTAEFINEYKSSTIQVTKAFSGIGALPDDFRITNDYNDDVFTVANADGTNPYIWKIEDVPVGTVIVFTEENIQADGFSLKVNLSGTASDTTENTASVSGESVEGEITAVTILNDYKRDIHVKKVDLATGNELEGATMQIIGPQGVIKDEWVSTTEVHVTKGLLPGVTYTLRETVAPADYLITNDIIFKIDYQGQVTSSGSISADGVLLVEDTIATQAKIVKVWDDDNNRDRVRPASLTVTLLADDAVLNTCELNEANGWSATVEDLPGFNKVDGQPHEIVYRWEEPEVPGYALSGTEKNGTLTTLTNSHKIEKTSRIVMKVWEDDDNRDGIRPQTLTVALYANGSPAMRDGREITVALTALNNWVGMAGDLPKFEDGVEIVYTWVEKNVPALYTLISTETVGILTTLTNSHESEETSVSVRKVWNDNNNAYGVRPAAIRVQLYGDGQACGDAMTLSQANGWTYTWTKLPKMAQPVNGVGAHHAISYTVEELEVPADYVRVITGSMSTGYIITNSLYRGDLIIEKVFDITPVVPAPTPTPEVTPTPTPEVPEETPTPTPEPETTDIPVIKTWVDNNNQDGNRPGMITVHLYADGAEAGSAVLTEASGWRYTFTGLPRTKDGTAITYTVSEDPVEWYVSSVSGYTITNTYQPEVTSATVRKVWNDSNNALGWRPAAIHATLSNGMTVTLSDANGWTATINNLPTRRNGQPVTYTWHEQVVLGYVQTGYEVVGDTTTFTNSLYVRPEPPEDKKVPKKKRGEELFIIDDYDTPLGVEVIINHVGDCFD